jgi:regulator of cell morphogenesis and NO signaling
MTHAHQPVLTDTLRALAAASPGAAGLFRQSGLGFCCGGVRTVAEAAADAGRDPQALLAELGALADAADRAAPEETGALIDHIEKRYHASHRDELGELVPLAEKVERVHGDHPEAPRGLADLLRTMAAEMDEHMTKEERILFPLMRKGGHPMIVHPIAAMRHDHDGHADQLRGIEHITHGLTPPDGACGSWVRLYAGVEKFAEDLVNHMHLENDILFPRFEG